MITCLKHKINYEHGECPVCKRVRTAITYSTNNPLHTSKFIMDKVAELNKITAKLKVINERVKELLKDNK